MSRVPFFVLLLALSRLGLPADALAAPRRPIFSVQRLEEVARSVRGLAGEEGRSSKELLEETQRRIRAAYPELVPPPGEARWFFNAVGGSLAEITILFCSPQEYLALWGSPLATDGFSGRYWKMDVWDIMLDGIMLSYPPGGSHQADAYSNGHPAGGSLTSLLHRGEGKHFQLKDGAYMIDYGRGDLLSSLKSGAMLGHRYVTGDRQSLNDMLKTCAETTFQNWLSPARRAAIERYRATNPDFDRH